MYRLLIADDEMIERKVLYKTLLEHFGDRCDIYQAANGREALAIFEEKGIEIAILDIEMPGIDGIHAAQEMRRRSPDCCIIFLTAFDDFNYAKKAISIQVLDYLLKPYEDQELISVVEEAIRLTEVRSPSGKDGDSDDMPQDGLGLLPPEAEEREEGVRMAMVRRAIEDYIQGHYQEEISMQDAARAMNYSEPYFSKLFKQIFQQNFTSYLTNYRMEEAKRRLALPTVNVKDVGIAVGYMDSNYFAKVFKRTVGVSPSDYRKEVFQAGAG